MLRRVIAIAAITAGAFAVAAPAAQADVYVGHQHTNVAPVTQVGAALNDIL